MASGQRCRSNAHIEFASAPGYDSFIGESQLQTPKCNLKSSHDFIIANEKICHAQRVRIECAARRDAEFAKAKPPEVLHARQNPRASDVDLQLFKRFNALTLHRFNASTFQ